MTENIRISFRGIWSHKMRSFLTMLGIIIGIAAIIAIVSTIKGTNEQIKNNLIGDGTNTVVINLSENDWEAEFSSGDIHEGIKPLDEDIRQDILDADGVESVSFYNSRNWADSVYYLGTSIDSASIYGIDRYYLDTAGLKLTEGRGLSEKELQGKVKAALIDETLRTAIFGDTDPVGKTIEINSEPFTIVGIVDKDSQFEPVINTIEDYYMYQGDERGAIYITDTSWPIVFRYDEPKKAIVKAKNTDSMTVAGRNAEEILNATLKLPEGMNITYKAVDLTDQAAQLQSLTASTNAMLIGIASISLLVGGIGVMNIMMVSVTERTREIGLKKALGAKKKAILLQFLTEAILLSLIGGIFGVAAGLILSKIISIIAAIPVAISVPAILVAVGFSMLVGVIFGFAPSYKASNLNPIDALRYE